jgi:hypothetical protein
MIAILLVASLQLADVRCWDDGHGGSICTQVRAGYGCWIEREKYWLVGVGSDECAAIGGIWKPRS